MIRGLDDDEVDHLTEIEDRKLNEERQQKQEELKELQDYRAKVAELQELSAEQVCLTLRSYLRWQVLKANISETQ